MKIGKLQGYDDVTNTYIDGFLPKPAFQFKDVLDSDYDNVTSISNWNKLGAQEFQYLQVRNYIGGIVIGTVGANYANWSALTSSDKILACQWGLAPYALRVSVIGEDEDVKYFKVLLEKTAGTAKENLIGRKRIVEEMRQFVGMNYFRKELFTKNDIDDFYSRAGNLLDSYIASNSPYFKWWLNNTVGTAYESNGFLQTTYYSSDLLSGVMNIYNGNY